MTRTEAYLVLNLLPLIGPVRVRRLLAAFGTPEAVLRARHGQIEQIDGFGPELAVALSQWESGIDLSRELRRIQEIGATIVTQEDANYPQPLREVYDPPLLFYVWGELLERDRHAIGVVGSRRATHYGTQSARKLSFQLAHAGLTVVSGLALGIDTAAHEGALAAKGRTIAVIGSGLGKLYPPENNVLAEKIAGGHGAVVTEFPVDYNPDKQSFPLRNRIVAAWGQGLLVVEAPARSGALITANQANDYGRTVYAVPGQIDRPTSQGCNRLIQNGARLVMSADDILEDLEWLIPPAEQKVLALGPQRPGAVLTPEEEAVYRTLGSDEVQFDALVERSVLPAATVTVALMKLELKKLVKQLPGRHFVRLVG
ncbi:MAG: DNA-processing protein DprA [Verrucomicrobiales bacterium]